MAQEVIHSIITCYYGDNVITTVVDKPLIKPFILYHDHDDIIRKYRNLKFEIFRNNLNVLSLKKFLIAALGLNR